VLTNAGFESGSLTGWRNNGNTSITSDAHSGTRAARTGPAAGGISREDIPVAPGSTVSFEVWAKVAGAPGWSGLGVGFRDASRVDLQNVGVQRQITQTSYTRQAFDVTVPAGAAFAYVWTWKNGTAGYLTVDDFCFRVADRQAPSKPANLAASNVTQTGFTLGWSASTDDVGVARYDVRRGGAVIGSSTTTSFPVAGLTPATTYAMSVTALDAAGNSTTSDTFTVTTQSSQPTSCGALSNNGFESGLTGWANNGNVTAVSSDSHSGAGAARTGTGEGGISTTAPIGVSAGQRVTFEVWAKISGTPGWSGLGVGFRDAAGADIDAGDSRQITETAYTRQSFEVIAPAGAAQAYIWTWKTGTTGSLLVDDFCLTVGSAPPGGTVWPNIRVVGNRMRDRYGDPFAIRGIESMYGDTGRSNPMAWVAGHKALGANTLGPLPNSSSTSIAAIQSLVDAAYQNGMIVGLNADHTGAGASFFQRSDVVSLLNRYPNVFLQESVELGSMDSMTADEWVRMAKSKVDAYVGLYPDKPIKIGSPSGGRSPRYALDRCQEVVAYYQSKGGRGGLIFTCQLYWQAGSSGTSWYQRQNGFTTGLTGILQAVDELAASPCMFLPGLDNNDDVGSTGWREIMQHVRDLDPNTATRLGHQWWVYANPGDPYANNLTTNELNPLSGITSVGTAVKAQLQIDSTPVELGPLN
jgi:hypothetical protein